MSLAATTATTATTVPLLSAAGTPSTSDRKLTTHRRPKTREQPSVRLTPSMILPFPLRNIMLHLLIILPQVIVNCYPTTLHRLPPVNPLVHLFRLLLLPRPPFQHQVPLLPRRHHRQRVQPLRDCRRHH
ncbi:hypothetical protein V8G54_029556 [Vigna mungo]|uniref:Uncharacterized protein n=1 Tax=Vigna mungo TaxID=3915 RepID=A0AAQ3RMR3_VIGMU